MMLSIKSKYWVKGICSAVTEIWSPSWAIKQVKTINLRGSKCKSQSYLREQLIHSLFNQWIKIIHGVARGTDKGVLAVPTLQIHNPVLNISRVHAQKNTKGDGRHWTYRRDYVQHCCAPILSLPRSRFFLHFLQALGCSSCLRDLHLTTTTRAVGSKLHLAPSHEFMAHCSEWVSEWVRLRRGVHVQWLCGDSDRQFRSSQIKSTCLTACSGSCKLVAPSLAQ